MRLLIDLGNTRLKWALARSREMRPGGVFAHAGRPLATPLRDEWSELAGVESAYVASVVSVAREQELDACLREHFGFGATFVRSPADGLGVRNAYAEPARLGVDRFLAMAAAHARAPRLQVLVSAGTALTVDALAADGEHLGGLIVPGPRLMREAVVGRTARVDAFEGRLLELPRSTADAVYSGSLLAAAGAIDRFTAGVAARHGAAPALLLGGGGGGELEAVLGPVERVHDLVLHGLALWAGTPT